MSNPSLPDLYHFIGFNADPADPTAIPMWTSVGHMLRTVDEFARGRQYELGQSRIRGSKIDFRDPDEYLNPVNTGSPYYPFCQPYRQMLHQAVWTRGQTGNLLNLTNWRVPADGSFESYTAGAAAPGWITTQNIGAVISTSNPQAGTKSLQGTTVASTNRQGIQFDVPCVPGMQYTTSAYVRQTAASTMLIRQSTQSLVVDPFNRTTASGWGSPPSPASTATPQASGSAWTLTGGANSDRSTTAATLYAPGYGSVLLTSTATPRYQTQAVGVRDVRQRIRVAVPAVATGSYMSAGLVARYTDASNHYRCELRFNTDRTVTIIMISRVAGVDTTITSAALDGVMYNAGDEFFLDFWVTQGIQYATAWRLGSIAPRVTWDSSSLDWLIFGGSTAISTAGAVGTRFNLDAGNTNSSPTFTAYNYSAVGALEGTSTSTTGAYVRLSVTYTATQPSHAVTVVTDGAALAGTLNIDSIQHEQAAAASAFTSTGSVVYPVARPYIERFPRTYDAAGYEGHCVAETVDNLAALAAVSLPSEYDYAVMELGPDYYWPLGDGDGTTLYPDATGNNNPPLGLDISKYGIGTIPSGGGAIDIPGAAGATGVQFTPPTPATGSKLAATVLGIGKLAESPGQVFAVPSSLTGVAGVWRMTVAMWVKVDNSGATQMGFYASRQIGTTAGKAYVPIAVGIDTGSGTQYSNVDSSGGIHVLSSGEGLSGINIMDGLPHLLVGIVVQDTAGNTRVDRLIDDQLDGTATATTASLGGALAAQTDSLVVGATDDGTSFLGVADGVIAKVAVWNRELDPSETAALYAAGHTAYAGESSATRIYRHITQGGYVGARRISQSTVTFDTGDPITFMQAPSWTGQMDLLTDTQNTTVAEQGTLWPAPDGAICTETREDRFLRLTPTYAFGEDYAGGEYPYEVGVAFDFDATFVFGNVEVSRPGGAAVTGGYAADVARARARYFARTYGANVDVQTDQIAQDLADWIFYSHRAPVLRVAGVTFHPAALAALWPMILGVEVGTRVTVKRRAKAANGGAGITMSADYFVETIRHHGIDMDAGQWWVDMELSPVGTAPGPTQQPWILENTTYSVLGLTTILGF